MISIRTMTSSLPYLFFPPAEINPSASQTWSTGQAVYRGADLVVIIVTWRFTYAAKFCAHYGHFCLESVVNRRLFKIRYVAGINVHSLCNNTAYYCVRSCSVFEACGNCWTWLLSVETWTTWVGYIREVISVRLGKWSSLQVTKQNCCSVIHVYVARSVFIITSCRRAAATICPRLSPSVGAEAPRAAEPADRNVAVGSHGQYVPTINAAAAWRVNVAMSKAAWWPLTLKMVSESRVTWATSVPILVLGLSVLDLGPMYPTDRRQTASLLNAPTY